MYKDIFIYVVIEICLGHYIPLLLEWLWLKCSEVHIWVTLSKAVFRKLSTFTCQPNAFQQEFT